MSLIQTNPISSALILWSVFGFLAYLFLGIYFGSRPKVKSRHTALTIFLLGPGAWLFFIFMGFMIWITNGGYGDE